MLDDTVAGTLTRLRGGRLQFEYDSEYRRRTAPTPLSSAASEDVPTIDESLDVVETRFDALVTEALDPRRQDSGSVASVRALTDLEVWRSLRDRGATPEAAVDEASAAVERWLDER